MERELKKLILTEKPSVARDFAKALKVSPKGNGFFESDDFIITWAIGHLLELKSPEDYDSRWKKWKLENLPIIPKKFEYKSQYKTKKQLDIVLTQLRRSDVSQIIVATDAGREGELIARNLLVFSRTTKKAFRFWTSQALSSRVINENLEAMKPLAEYDRLYQAGRCRQGADWLVGMNLSRLATIKMGDLFSIGRVQTAVLGLLVKRRKEIDNFVPSPYYNLQGKFGFEDGELDALWFDPEKKENSTRLESEQICQQIVEQCENKTAKVERLKTEKKNQIPPQLYSLTELQRQANRRYGFSASRTLKAAQSLYERYKCLSYPRTDARVLGNKSYYQVQKLMDSFEQDYAEYAVQLDKSKITLKNRLVFNDSKLTDHHALIPLKKFTGKPTTDEGKIFDLVIRRFFSVFSNDYVFNETNVVIKVLNNHFKTKGQQVVCMGWKELEGKEKDILLPALKPQESGTVVSTKFEKKFTKPPFEYTEATLLYDMVNPARLVENKEYKKIFRTEVGLGTQATRAQIIETLIKRTYIVRDKKCLKATEKGVVLIDTLDGMPLSSKLSRSEETARWELELEKISQGIGDEVAFAKDIIGFIQSATAEWTDREVQKVAAPTRSRGKKTKVPIGKCPLCGADVMDYPKSFGCSKWKSGCKFTIWKTIAGKRISAKIATTIVKEGKTGPLKGFKSKKGSSFSASLVLEGNNIRLDF